MSSREAARATTSTVAASAAAGILSGSSPASGSFGKSSAGNTLRWKLELPLRISTSRSLSRVSISTVEPASDLETSARSRPGRSTEPSPETSAGSVVVSPMSRSVAAKATSPSPTVRRTPESAWVAARVETARETIESLETSSSR